MNLNPLDLRGPQFLCFYAVFSSVFIFAVRLIRQALEGGEKQLDLEIRTEVAEDPYQIAYLRGGRNEVIRVAVVSLIDRKLMSCIGMTLAVLDAEAAEKVRRPLDKAILTKFAEQGSARKIFFDKVILDEAEAVGGPLREKQLMPDAQVNFIRGSALLLGGGLLLGVAGMKIAVAISRGHYNIAFLILMAIAALAFLVFSVFPRRTARGERIMGQISRQFLQLKVKPKSSRGRQEANVGDTTFAIAVFGFAVLPIELEKKIKPLALTPPPDFSVGNCDGGSSCGSGSSCGGGGGGGCGGCGG